jgi:hypothetical protein
MEHEDQSRHMLRRVMQVGQLLAGAEGPESDETPEAIRASRTQPGSRVDSTAAERRSVRMHPDKKS